MWDGCLYAPVGAKAEARFTMQVSRRSPVSPFDPSSHTWHLRFLLTSDLVLAVLASPKD